MLKISIPVPCHEDWDAMIPNGQGRHCNSCVKTVVDFTTMSDEEVKYFFLNKKEEKVCGRFRNEQLHRITITLPHNIFYIPMPFWKKFLVASLLVFSASLFSCNTTTKGDAIENTVANEYEVKEYSIGKGFPAGTELPPPPPPVCTIVGVMMVPPITQGTPVTIVTAPEQGLTGIVAIADTAIIEPPIKTIPIIVGEIKMQVVDSIKTKNPAKLDSINCDQSIFTNL